VDFCETYLDNMSFILVFDMKIAEYVDIPLSEKAGGVGTYICSVSRELEMLGHEVLIIDGSNRPRLFANHHLVNICKDADIHHFHEPSTSLLTFKVRRLFKQSDNFVITFHYPVFSKLLEIPYSFTIRFQYANAYSVLTSTKRNANYLRSKGISSHVIPLWAEQIFRPSNKKRYARKRFVLSVCVCDRWHSYKNFLMLSRIAKVLSRKFGVNLVHVGPRDFDIPYVEHYGVVKPQKLSHLYQEALALVLPSIGPYEGFGIVAAEALSSATPVLVSDEAGISEFLDGSFVSPLSIFMPRLCAMVDGLINDPSPIIDKAQQEGQKFQHKNCRKTVDLILSSRISS